MRTVQVQTTISPIPSTTSQSVLPGRVWSGVGRFTTVGRRRRRRDEHGDGRLPVQHLVLVVELLLALLGLPRGGRRRRVLGVPHIGRHGRREQAAAVHKRRGQRQLCRGKSRARVSQV